MKNHLGETIKKGSIVKSSSLFKQRIKEVMDEEGDEFEENCYWSEFSGVPVKRTWSLMNCVELHHNGYPRVYNVNYVELDK